MDIQEVRKYRIQLSAPFFNKESKGIALFDLVLSFVGAYILNYLFNVSRYIPGGNKLETYYVLVVPIGIIAHILTSQDTFLNKQVLSSEMNGYKIIVACMLFVVFKNVVFRKPRLSDRLL